MNKRAAAVKRLIQNLNRRFGYYKSPASGRTLTDALREEFSNMDSLFSQAYDAIVKQEQEVDDQVTSLLEQVRQLTETNSQLSASMETTAGSPATAAPHDGGFIFTVKGRKVGSPDDRDRLDKAIDRVTPEAPADPDFKPAAAVPEAPPPVPETSG